MACPVPREGHDAPRLGRYVISRQPTQKGVGAFSGLDADAAIDGLYAVETVMTGLSASSAICGRSSTIREIRKQHIPQRGEVGGGRAAESEQPWGGAYRSDQVVGIGVGERASRAARQPAHRRPGRRLRKGPAGRPPARRSRPIVTFDAAGPTGWTIHRPAGCEFLLQQAEATPDLVAPRVRQPVAGIAGPQQARHIRPERDGNADRRPPRSPRPRWPADWHCRPAACNNSRAAPRLWSRKSQPPRDGSARKPAISSLARSWRMPSRSGMRPAGDARQVP